MPDITPSFVMKYERRMRAISEKEYARRLAKMWAQKILRLTPIEGAQEIISFLLQTATIEPIGPSGVGGLAYENMFAQSVMIAPMTHGKGLNVKRDQLEDLNGTGLQQLSEWSEQIAIETACYPERLAIQMILNGANTDGSATCYDGTPFFNKSLVAPHLFNPFRAALGGFQNWFTGSASGAYPGALPIDDSVTTDVAVVNLGKAMSAIANVKMPNGINGRKLTPKYLLAPQRMAPRVRQLLDAKFIAQTASTGAGSANVEAIIRGFGLAEPIFSEEIGAAFTYQAKIPVVDKTTGVVKQFDESLTGSDTTYYMICAEAETSQLGGLLHCMRRPFEIRYFTGAAGMGDGERAALSLYLSRARELDYQCDGRQSVQYGHPWTIFRFDTA
jgi:hypothetical protein